MSGFIAVLLMLAVALAGIALNVAVVIIKIAAWLVVVGWLGWMYWKHGRPKRKK